jgi:hypothetical protein
MSETVVKKTKKKETVKQYLDRLSKEGKTIKVTWDGGGDNGTFDLEVDDVSQSVLWNDDSPESAIISRIESVLGYGSFAGEFYCSGYVEYVPEKKEFIGTDTYSKEETFSVTLEKPLQIEIPIEVHFDRIDILIERDCMVQVSLFIKDGPVLDFHLETEEMIQSKLEDFLQGDKLGEIIGKLTEEEWNTSYDEKSYDFSSLKKNKKGTARILEIKEIDYSTDPSTDKEIVVSFK